MNTKVVALAIALSLVTPVVALASGDARFTAGPYTEMGRNASWLYDASNPGPDGYAMSGTQLYGLEGALDGFDFGNFIELRSGTLTDSSGNSNLTVTLAGYLEQQVDGATIDGAITGELSYTIDGDTQHGLNGSGTFFIEVASERVNGFSGDFILWGQNYQANPQQPLSDPLLAAGMAIPTPALAVELYFKWSSRPGSFVDLNLDGFVDGLDLGILLQNFGQNGIPPFGGEINGTDPVDGLDLGRLLGSWFPARFSPAVTVPEPSMTMLAVGLVATLGLFYRLPLLRRSTL